MMAQNAKKQSFLKAIVLMILLFCAGPHQCIALTPEEKGLQIAIEADNRDKGWLSGKVEATMILRDRNGNESKREMHVQDLEQKLPTEGDKMLLVFDYPKDIKNTALLSYIHVGRPDDQWLYLPALKRVKRIASYNRSGPFVGSEFAYEDIVSQEVGNYSYKYINDEIYNGIDCFVVERYPVEPNTSYARHKVWYDKKHYRMQKNELYDRHKNILFKTLSFYDYNLHLGKYWRANTMHMVNHITGKETVFQMRNHHLRKGYTERDFDLNSLKSAR